MKIGSYEVLDQIGRGGMGTVFRARNASGETVAVKVLERLDEPSRGRFDRERRLLAKLGAEDGFVPLLDSGVVKGTPYIVMPWLGGGTLRARIEAGPLPIAEAESLGRALARALARAHGAGIVHRDLKPENVLFDSSGRPFVADLGIAKRVAPGPESRPSITLSKTGDALGTFGYMAPEQLDDAKSAGPRADVYAWGATLYECLTGKPAFGGPTGLAVLDAQLAGKVEPLAAARPDAPAALVAVVERALLSKERFADGGELLRALEGRSPRRGAALLLVTIALLVGGALLLLATRSAETATADPPPPPPPPPSTAVVTTAALPERCAGFARSKRTRLSGFHGTRGLVHLGPIGGVAFSGDGRLAGSASHDGTIRIWDVERRRAVRTLRTELPVLALAFLPAERCVTADLAGTLRTWDLRVGEDTANLPALGTTVWGLSVSRDGRRLLAATEDGKPRLFDLDSGKVLRVLEGHKGPVHSVALSADGLRAVSCGEDGTTRLWDLSDGAEIASFRPHGSRVDAAVLLPDGVQVLTGGAETVVRISDATKGTALAALEGHTGNLLAAAVSQDGLTAVTGGVDARVNFWDLKARRLLHSSAAHKGFVKSVAISPDGRRALSGGLDEEVHLWDTATGAELPLLDAAPEAAPYAGHRGPIRAIAIAPDGTRAVTTGLDARVLVWDPRGPTLLGALEGHTNQVVTVAISADGRRAVTGSRDATARLWDLETREGRVIETGLGPVNAVVFAATGREDAVVATDDGVIRVIDVERTKVLHALRGHKGGVLSLAAVPGTRRVVSGGGDGSVRWWDLDSGSEVPPNPLVARAPVHAVLATANREVIFASSARFGGDVMHWTQARGDRSVAAPGQDLAPIGRLATGLLLFADTRSVQIFDLVTWRTADAINLSAAHADATALAVAPGGEWFLVGDSRGELLRFELSKH